MINPHRDYRTVLFRHTFFMLSVFALCISQWTAAQTLPQITHSRTISPGDTQAFDYNLSQLSDLYFYLTKPSGLKATINFTPSMAWVRNTSSSFNTCGSAQNTFARLANHQIVLPESLFSVTISGDIDICEGEGEGEGTTPGYDYTLNTQANLSHIIEPENPFAVIGEGLLLSAVDATQNNFGVAVDWPSSGNGYTLQPDASSKVATFTATEPGEYEIPTTGASGTAYADSTFTATVTSSKPSSSWMISRIRVAMTASDCACTAELAPSSVLIVPS